MKIATTHINCDLGEGMANEVAIIPYINACSLACGGHFGNLKSIEKSMRLAQEHHVICGAHPSYPDLENFGRLSLKMTKEAFIGSIQKQLILFSEVYKKIYNSPVIPHIKAHGALYNDLCKNSILTDWYLEALAAFQFSEIYTQAEGVLYEKATTIGLKIKKEAFIDRLYTSEGFLVSRKIAGSVIEKDQEVLTQFKTHLEHGHFISIDGSSVQVAADTYCLHGDHPNTLARLMLLAKN